jgi:ADP-ribose pyrophosphatase YjhB (NUDIX family)
VTGWKTWQYRVSRLLGRITVRAAAALTLGRMPSFVSASALVMEEDRVLVVVDPIRDEPVLPGGHLKWDEDPRLAVIREVQEETGLMVRPLELLGVFAGKEWAGERGIVRIVYRAVTDHGELRSSPEGEARWMPLSELLATDSRDLPILRSHVQGRPTTALP